MIHGLAVPTRRFWQLCSTKEAGKAAARELEHQAYKDRMQKFLCYQIAWHNNQELYVAGLKDIQQQVSMASFVCTRCCYLAPDCRYCCCTLL